MPVKEGPVPPFPDGADPEEYDRLRRRVLWKMPSGLYVVGATDKGERRNAMTLNWASQMSFDPKWIGIGVEHEAFTHELISAGGVYALCLVDREDRAIVRKFTKPVEVDLHSPHPQRLWLRRRAVRRCWPNRWPTWSARFA